MLPFSLSKRNLLIAPYLVLLTSSCGGDDADDGIEQSLEAAACKMACTCSEGDPCIVVIDTWGAGTPPYETQQSVPGATADECADNLRRLRGQKYGSYLRDSAECRAAFRGCTMAKGFPFDHPVFVVPEACSDLGSAPKAQP